MDDDVFVSSRKMKEWVADHEVLFCPLKNTNPRLGGGFMYRFIPTNQGMLCDVICNKCGQKMDMECE